MTDMIQLSRDYQRIEAAIAFLENDFAHQPPLADIAAAAGLSEFHFQRLFSRWVGISPKRFLQFLTKEYARRLIHDSASVLEASYDAGLSGPGRLHDLMVACEAVTPGEIRQRGRGLAITYGIHPSPFGACLLAATERGICNLRFVPPGGEEDMAAWLQTQWPQAALRHDPATTAPLAARVFAFEPHRPPAPLHLHVRGTNFQIQVWQALLRIPLGKAVTYEDLARHIGLPRSARAVGNAVGRNPVPFLIPCHRVIRKMGIFGHYGEGPARKKAILGWEAARVHPAGPPGHRPA
jgi:AraC family transcriptional regulator of adaptative response/methylated-DNA-[protein]-cysteine methyltransferase